MRRREKGLRRLALAFGLVISISALAQPPRLGQQAPVIDGRDLFEKIHSSHEWLGRRTLVVAITDKDAGEEAKRWFKTASLQLPNDIRLASIVSIELPFFATEGMARDVARDQTPKQYWPDTWLDRDGKMRKGLGLPVDRVPWVFALDDAGRVVASAHALSSDANAVKRLWEALGVG